ncbi:C2 calcium/lipid-binding plant phosphoribosyltransferase family protein [Perilla frutescens var. hirtella]|nr:C2 calcium/lipid-binding plant phosphoribosyltransferase family protein [Perilla frutescens var. frutescens]KAH6800796.1 C2 calcium/lipid-binding plant phosphoribosyltransferase family protein [Perilla frutescens var. hirtella]
MSTIVLAFHRRTVFGHDCGGGYTFDEDEWSQNRELRGAENWKDLVDQMPFIYVRVVKEKISNPDADSSFCAKLVIGTHSTKTKSQAANKEWDQVFTFDKEGLNSTSLEVSIRAEKAEKKVPDKDVTEEISARTVSFDLQEVPKRVPLDSPLAPQWYSLEGEGSPGNDIMLSVWVPRPMRLFRRRGSLIPAG